MTSKAPLLSSRTGADAPRIGAARTATPRGVAVSLIAAALLGACGGGDNPLGNPPDVANPQSGTNGQKLSFVYYQQCINPILTQPIAAAGGGSNTCASSGCHGIGGTGGALKLVGGASVVDLSNAANTPAVVRASADMYKNYYSAQGSTVLGDASKSKLVNKPLVRIELHGGGLIFANDQDPNVKRIQYWIGNPVPQGQDEFSTAAGNAMFTPADAATGVCNSQ